MGKRTSRRGGESLGLPRSPRRSSSVTAIYAQFGAGNLPLAAALSLVPLVVVVIYLLVARRLGAFEAL